AVPVSLPGWVHMIHHAGNTPWQAWALLLLFVGVVVASALRGRRGFVAYVQRNLEAQAATVSAQASVARLERIGALAQIGPWELDAATGVVTCAAQTARTLGIPPDQPHTADTLLARLAPASAAELRAAVNEALQGGRSFRLEAAAPDPRGGHRTLLVVGRPVDGAGQVLRIEGAVQDVTQLRQMDRALADQARLNEQLLQNTEQGIWFLDNQGLTSDLNQAMCRLLGRQRQEVMGRPVFDFFTGPDRAVLDRQLEPRKEGNKQGYEIGIVRPDGSRVECFNNATPIHDASGAKVGSVGMWTDLTPIKQAQALLQHREAELQALLGSFPGYIAAIEKDLRYSFVNDATAERLGHPAEEIVGQPIERFLSPRDLVGMTRDIQARFAHAGQAWTFERTYEGAHGLGPVTVQVIQVAGPARADGGQTFYTFGLDVSERKRAQDALVAAKEEAERASQAKTQFLSQMSHELRTPLNAILGFGQLLSSDTQWPLAPAQELKVHEILAGAGHLLNLINGLLDLGRIEEGRFAVELAPIDLEALVGEALALMQPVGQRHQVQVPTRWTAPRPGLTVQADRTRLMQVLLNLIGNAVKYNRAGGAVTLKCRDAEDRVWLGVKDEGKGLSDEDQDRLFQPFQRLGAERSGIEGTGIGLALSRRLVQAMGGQIGVDSTQGQGSTFWVLLPLGQPNAAEQPAAAASGAGDLAGAAALPALEGAPPGLVWAGGHDATGHVEPGEAPLAATVLYIEDNPVNAMVMEAMVTRLPGLVMISADDGAPGLEMALRERPDLILTDIQMPGMDGFELMARLQQHEQTRHIPVIAISADALPESVERGRRAGFADYLTKPVEMGVLHAAIGRALRQIRHT
ncbi:MAG: PAS domain S-box protein, partial [Rubrivivax sp.]